MQDNMETGTATGADSLTNESQAATNQQVKTFTQDEVNKIVASRLAKVESKYADVNIDEYREFKNARAKQEEDALIKRQEFDKVLTQTKDHYQGQIGALKRELETIKVDGAIMNAASQLKVVAPDHVAKLLKSNVRLGEGGQVEVLDDKGEVRYNAESATPLTVDELVKEFVSKNPFYRAPGPAGTGSKNNGSAERVSTVDLTKLDLKNPRDRELYRQFKANQ